MIYSMVEKLNTTLTIYFIIDLSNDKVIINVC